MVDPTLIAVVGAGNMGAGIAQKIAQEGYTVLLADIDQERAEAGLDRIAKSLAGAVKRRILSEEDKDATLARVTPVGVLDKLKDCDLVIEAIFENLLVKKELFRNLDRICKPGCILATNTSSFYVGELASVTERPGEFVGLHYFFHPAKNRLLEVIPGHLTRPEVVEAMGRFAEGHGKTALYTKDAPGFCVNRYFVPWLNEAVRLLEEGTADIATIEWAAKKAFRIGMGPFELMNVTGVPVGYHAASTLGTELGAFYEPADALRAQAEAGLWALDGEPDESKYDAVVERLLGTVFLIAGQLIDESVCSAEDVNRGARIGLRWSKGPFELMNRMGIAAAVACVEALCLRYEDLSMPDCLAAQAETGEAFAFQRVDLAVKEGIATITINRPEVMNALDEEVVGQLTERFDEALATEGLRAVVIAGAGKAFVAGADISYFVKNIESGDLDRIVRFTKGGHALLRTLETAPVPVIARVQGMALGGGVELALACHAIVCSTKASFALPETGIGIYPGLGGTQRLPRIVGRPLARRMIFTGRPVGAQAAVEAGLALAAVPLRDLDTTIGDWVDKGLPDHYAGTKTHSGPVAEAYDDRTAKELLSGSCPDGLSEAAQALAEKDLRAIGRKAPIALATAARLIDEGTQVDLPAGLSLELDALATVFGTADALLGLKSVGSRETPPWVGA